MYWNCRVMQRLEGAGTDYEETNLYIVEVFYNEDDTVMGWTEKEAVWGEDLEALKNSLTWMLEATEKPILIEADLLREAENLADESDLLPGEELLTMDEVLDSLGLEREDISTWEPREVTGMGDIDRWGDDGGRVV